jgi:hypothetical protein
MSDKRWDVYEQPDHHLVIDIRTKVLSLIFVALFSLHHVVPDVYKGSCYRFSPAAGK